MGLQFAAALPSQRPAILNFLLDVFHADPRLNSFQPQVMDWKYFSPHPAWSGPRSFLVHKDEQIVGHGGIWPIRLATGDEGTQAIHLVDWAASPAALGAGVHLLRSISQIADVMITIGGSQDTRKILPKLGYKSGGILRRYVRVVRPWLQLRTRARQDWKAPLRFLRNARDMLTPLPRVPAGWRIERITSFGEEVHAALKVKNSSPEISPIRAIAGLNYVLACPAAEFAGFVVRHSARLIGYFIVATIGHQARIVELKTTTEDPGQSRAICAAAARTAADDPRVAELVVGTSSQRIGKIWQQLGFQLRRQDAILYLDNRNLGPGTEFELNLIDGDVCFMYNPGQPYIS